MGRIDTATKQAKTELLVVDGRTSRLYDFGKGWPNNNVATFVYNVFSIGWTGGDQRITHGTSWNPKTIAGNSNRQNQDSAAYVECHGTRSFILDDDGCYCEYPEHPYHCSDIETLKQRVEGSSQQRADLSAATNGFRLIALSQVDFLIVGLLTRLV